MKKNFIIKRRNSVKRFILFLVALMLVAGGAFGQADLGGKLEFESSIFVGGTRGSNFQGVSGDNTADTENRDVNSSLITAEINLTAVVDDFNSVTVEFRDNLDNLTGATELQAEGAAQSISFGSIFLTTDIAGVFGMTDLTDGLNLKYKGGWFRPELREVGEIKDIIEVSDVNNAAATWDETHSRNLGSIFTIGWQDFVNLEVGLLLASQNTKATDVMFSVYGAVPAGPGTFEYLAFFVETDQNQVLGDPDSGQVGGGLEYRDIAVGGDISLGIGVEGHFDLENNNWGLGVNLVADISNWLDVDLDFGIDPFETHETSTGQNFNLGVGLDLQDPTETVGLTAEVGIEDLTMRDGTLDPRVEAGLFIKPGAARLTAGWRGESLGVANAEQHTIYLAALIEY